MPSSSIRAKAAVSWSAVATSTERPRSSAARPFRTDPWTSSLKATVTLGPQRKRPERFPAALASVQSDDRLLCGLCCGGFIELDKFAHGDRQLGILGVAERVHPERVRDANDDDRETQRIEAGFQQRQIVGKRS